MWTVGREFDQPIRHKNQAMSGGSYLANLTLRLAPNLDRPGVIFTSMITDPAAAEYVPYVEEGVRRFVARRATEGCEIGHLSVTLIAMAFHIVDAKGYRYREAAEMALAQAFDAAGMEL